MTRKEIFVILLFIFTVIVYADEKRDVFPLEDIKKQKEILDEADVTHSGLTNLAWNVSGHTGTASNFAGFDGTGAAAYYPESDYILVAGTRALTGNWDAGSFDIRSQTGTFDSLTSGRVPIVSTDGLLVDDSDLTFATDTLTATKIAAFELTGKLTAGATEIEGGAFDINGGTVDSITSLTVANNVDIGNFTLTANGLTIDGTFTDGTMSISGGNLTVVGTIGASGDSDLLSLASGALTVNGTIDSGKHAITATGTAPILDIENTDSNLRVIFDRSGGDGGGLSFHVANAFSNIVFETGAVFRFSHEELGIMRTGATGATVWSLADSGNVTGTGTLTGHTSLTVDNITINANTIASDTGTVSFINDHLTTTGNITTTSDVFVGNKITHFADSDTYIEYTPDNIDLTAGGNNLVGISSSSVDIGDNANGDLVQIAQATGQLTLAGDARVIKHVQAIDELGKGGSAPTVRITEEPYVSYTYAVNNDSHITFEIPEDMDFTAAAEIKVHWYTSVSQTDDEVNWEARWNSRAPGEAVNTGETTDTSGDINCSAQWIIVESTIETVPANSCAAGDIFGLHLERIAIVGGTNPTANSIHALSVEFHYIADKIGEAI